MSASIDRFQTRIGALMLGAVGLALLALAGRVVYINAALGQELAEAAERQQIGASVIPARRGMILDVRGRVVANSREVPDVFVDPTRIENVEQLSQQLAVRVNQTADGVADEIRRRPQSRYIVIARGVDEVTAEAVRAMRHPGVGLTLQERREYPLRESMAHLLGWVGRDGSGMEGVELAFNDHLCGSDGRHATLRDARRRPMGRRAESIVPPIDGGHLVLTIDAEIQRITEESLERGVQTVAAESGVAIVLAPDCGDVLAMACHPTFDPNDPFQAETADIRRNRAVTDPIEPGSTFKPLLACGALSGAFVSPNDEFDCHMGSHYFGSRLVRDTKPRGVLDLKGIITYSSNIGMGQIAERMGNEALFHTVRAFGLGARLGIDLPGESGGVVYPLARWTKYSATSIAMGYEVLVTPLQLAAAFGAIVNDGVLVRPRVVRRLLSPDGRIVGSFDAPETIRRVVSADVARYVARDLLVSVVENGGGGAAKTGPYRVLGKTGTAKLVYPDRSGYETGAYLGLFVGAAPVDDPRIVVLVMIRRPDPKIAYYGGKVAAPVAGEIITRTLAYREVPPDQPKDASRL